MIIPKYSGQMLSADMKRIIGNIYTYTHIYFFYFDKEFYVNMLYFYWKTLLNPVETSFK